MPGDDVGIGSCGEANMKLIGHDERSVSILRLEVANGTKMIWDFGEIGSSQEEELAQLIRDQKITKPVIAYIGGKAAREGTRRAANCNPERRPRSGKDE
jgi:succinyl-CoA synthetase alpha subunit